MGHICPMLANHYPKIFSIFIFFYFKCILLQISHNKCFFINIFIPMRSGIITLHVMMCICMQFNYLNATV